MAMEESIVSMLEIWAARCGDSISEIRIRRTGPENVIFDANVPALLQESTEEKYSTLLTSPLKRTVMETTELILFGTGDREHPKSTTVVDRLYTLKDRNPSTVLKESNLIDVTEDLLQSSGTSATDKQTILNNLKSASGWYIRLNQNVGRNALHRPSFSMVSPIFRPCVPSRS